MRTGELDRRITLRRPTKAQDSYGEPLITYADEATVWAKVTPIAGGESYEGDQRTNKQRVEVLIRYRAGMEANAWLFVYDGETYEIEDVQEVGRREGLKLTAYAREVKSGA